MPNTSNSGSAIAQPDAFQTWLTGQDFSRDEEHNRDLQFLICNTIDTDELPNANGQAAEFLNKLDAALRSAPTEGVAAAAQRVRDAISEIDRELVREYFQTSRMGYEHFRELADGTVLVVTGMGMWFQQQDPAAIARFHGLVAQEREIVQRNLQALPENAAADLEHALMA